MQISAGSSPVVVAPNLLAHPPHALDGRYCILQEYNFELMITNWPMQRATDGLSRKTRRTTHHSRFRLIGTGRAA